MKIKKTCQHKKTKFIGFAVGEIIDFFGGKATKSSHTMHQCVACGEIIKKDEKSFTVQK